LSAGTHTITASVTDSNGAPGSASISVTVNAAPTVSITAPENGATFTPDEEVAFTGSASDLEDGDLTGAIQWSSSLDGPIGTGGLFSTSALSSGTHTITASVTDSGGKTGSDSITIDVTAAPPQANFSATPTFGAAPLLVSFTDTSTGDITSWNWTFSDGGSASGQNVTHTFTEPGSYTATLSVIGPGGSSTHTGEFGVTAPPLVASFSASPLVGIAPLSVHFVDTSTGDVTSWSWSFSDGGIASGPDVTHVFTTPGDHTATLVVSGPGGTSTAIRHLVVISPPTEIGPPGRDPVGPPGGNPVSTPPP
jgi:PKD repeat protein